MIATAKNSTLRRASANSPGILNRQASGALTVKANVRFWRNSDHVAGVSDDRY